MITKHTLAASVAALLVLLPAAATHAQGAIGWNYQGVGGIGLTPTDTAGAPGFAQDNWNNHPGNGQGPGNVPFEDLVDDSGAPATADVTVWTLATNNSWQHNQTSTADEILMNDFSNQQPSITFAQIPYTANGYTVVVYYGNNEGPSTSTLTVGTRSRTITTGDTAQSSYGINGYLEGTDLNAGTPTNYSVFPGNSGADLTVSLTGSNNNGLSAIQIVEELATDAPGPPSGPDPADLAFDVAVDKTLDWSDSNRADEYDVYLWVFGQPEPAIPTATVSASEYTPPGGLQPNEDYDWRVVARNTSSGATTSGPVWTFLTGVIGPPEEPFQLSPLDGATAVDPAVALDWDESARAASYNLYLWIPPASKPAAPTAVLTATLYDPPGDLLAATTYHWTVESVNASGTTPAFDPFWSFTTQAPPAGPPSNPNPPDQATAVPAITALDWDDVPNATSYNVRLWFSFDLRPDDPDAVVTESSYQPPFTLFVTENYSWEIEAVNSVGTTTGGPWTFTVGDAVPGIRKIGWNFVGVGGVGLNPFNVAGAPGFTQSEWNNHAGDGQAPGTVPFFDLYDDASTITTTDVVGWTQSAANSWQHSQTATPDEILMNDFANQQASIEFAEIPYANYDVVVYYGNNEGPTTSTLTVGPQSRTITTGDTARSSHRNVGYLEGTDLNPDSPTNYSVFTGLSGTGLTVAMTGGGNNGLSAIQIVDAGGALSNILITSFSRAGDTVTITFTAEPGVTTWQVKASTNLLSFPIDETPDATITEGPPGSYSADVNVSGDPTPYFLRIEN